MQWDHTYLDEQVTFLFIYGSEIWQACNNLLTPRAVKVLVEVVVSQPVYLHYPLVRRRFVIALNISWDLDA